MKDVANRIDPLATLILGVTAVVIALLVGIFFYLTSRHRRHDEDLAAIRKKQAEVESKIDTGAAHFNDHADESRYSLTKIFERVQWLLIWRGHGDRDEPAKPKPKPETKPPPGDVQ